MINDQIFKGVLQGVSNWLEVNNIEFFLGGSRRFGYETYESDLDIFVLQVGEEEKKDFRIEMKDSGFGHLNSADYPYETFSFKGIIHIIMVDDADEFRRISRQHNEVEDMVSRNEKVKNLIKLVKSKARGREIYEMLIKLV